MPAAAAPLTEVNLDPENYHQVSPYDLLVAAARGRIGLDHRFLHGILDDREKTMPDLVRFAAGNLGHYPINLEDDLVAIFRYFRAEEAVPFYLKLIRENPEDINDELIDSLSNLGRPALEPLLQIHEELGEENAGDVPFALSALQVRDPRILGILTARLEYDVSDAALCLEVYGDPEALPALEKTLAEISPDDAALRKTVEDVIETLRAPEESVPDPQPLNIWDIYPETAPPVFDVLSEADRLDMLESSSAGRRKEAAESFLNSQLSPAAKSKLIRLAKSDPDAGVRGRAWESLADESDEPEIRRAMLEIAENPAAPLDERSGAVVGLAQHSDQARVRRLILDLYEKPEGRAKALEAMWRSFDRSFTAYPPRHLHDDDPATRRQAIWGVGQLRISQSAPQLKEFFEDDEYRVDALFNYTLSMPGNVSPGRARAMLEKVEKTAAGLTAGETELVQMAIDQRLVEDGMRPVFHEDLAPEQKQEQPGSAKIGRNDPCPCGSGKKYKKCHGA